MSNNKTVKSVKVQIIKPTNMSWKVFGKSLREIQEESRTIKNQSVVICMDYFNISRRYYEQTGAYPKLNKENLLGVSKGGKEIKCLKSFCYDVLYDTKSSKSNSGNIDTEVKSVTDIFKPSDKHEAKVNQIRSGKQAPPYYKDNSAITIKGQNIKVYKQNASKGIKAGYYFNLGMYSRSYSKSIDHKGFVSVLVDSRKANQKAILDRVISGEYKSGTCNLTYDKRKNKWYINLAYQFESEEKKLNEDQVLGVDLGITNAVVMQVYNIKNNRFEYLKYNQCMIDGRELISFRQRTEARKRSLQRQSKLAGEGRKGHGRKTKMKPVYDIGNKVERFRDTYNHKVSKYVVDYAIKNDCKTIQMEDLSGFTEKAKESLMKNWSYYDLQTKIEYKAKEYGIKVEKVNPRYTSKRCSECGCIHNDNRDGKKNQAKFKCVSCGYETNADINAARNIAIPYIDVIISEELKKSKDSA